MAPFLHSPLRIAVFDKFDAHYVKRLHSHITNIAGIQSFNFSVDQSDKQLTSLIASFVILTKMSSCSIIVLCSVELLAIHITL